ncbi:MAG: DivIVA domain-containing protein [Atopobiaceae bacterium]|nr:DivIVA domain-containing protein [Atopobiaceae bacterium]MBR3314993.1 DivIVA domain-containing protein [Atopobiaceae bacterium]
MAITPADIEQLTFSASKRGYDTDEVDNFLEQLSVEVDSMLQKIADLKGRLNASEAQLQSSQAKVASLQQQVSELEIEVSTRPVAPVPQPVASSEYSVSERQISQVLIVAQQSADKLVADARDNADRIRTEADQKAREVIRQALAEKQNELDEIDRLKQSREDFRAEYKRLLQHFMDDADSVFPNQDAAPSPAPVLPKTAAPAPVVEPETDFVDADATAMSRPIMTAPIASMPGEDFSDLD